MKKKWFSVAGILIVLFLMAIGWAIFQWANPGEEQMLSNSFRTWFWEHKKVDLAIQIGLVFAGTLGIAAILPDEEKK